MRSYFNAGISPGGSRRHTILYEFCTLDFLNPLKRNIQTSYDFLWDYCSAPFWSSDVKDAGGSRIRPPIKIVCTVLTSTYIHTFESTWPEDQRTLTLDHNLVPGYLPQTPPRRLGLVSLKNAGMKPKPKVCFSLWYPHWPHKRSAE
jgi:hypothetical protein